MNVGGVRMKSIIKGELTIRYKTIGLFAQMFK